MKRILAFAALWLALASSNALASQATWITPSSPLPMTSLATFLNNGLQAVGTFNSGSSAPSSGPAGAPIANMCWWNTNANPNVFECYDGANWDSVFSMNTSTHAISFLPMTIIGGTLAQGQNALTITATLVAVASGTNNGVFFDITSAGSSSQSQRGMRLTLEAGYTGSFATVGVDVADLVNGTGATIPGTENNQVVGNVALGGNVTNATTGYNWGVVGHAQGGVLNIGVEGLAQVSQNSGTNIGVWGGGYNAGTGTAPEIGVFASLAQTSIPTVSAALIADNGASSNPIFLGRVNGVTTDTIDNLGDMQLTPGTLANGANAFLIAATQPTSPVAQQAAVIHTITGAGSASQVNIAFQIVYAAGYTGSSNSIASSAVNSNAGTSGSITVNNYNGNASGGFTSNATTTGYNIGVGGRALGGNVNIGSLGIAGNNKASATNIGAMGSATNTGGSSFQIGGWFTNGQTTIPTVSAALIADNGSQSNAIALFMNAGSTVASINQTGGITATLTNVASTSAVCYNTSSGLFTYDSTIGTCNTSDENLKIFKAHLINTLDQLVAISRSPHFGYFEWTDPRYGEGLKIGVGAQTVARFFPELTATGSDGLMSLAYDKLTIPIIEALAELKADNDNLRHELKTLKETSL